jgi:hypothetical protein
MQEMRKTLGYQNFLVVWLSNCWQTSAEGWEITVALTTCCQRQWLVMKSGCNIMITKQNNIAWNVIPFHPQKVVVMGL